MRPLLLALAFAVTGWLGAVSPAVAAQRLERFDLPSSAGNIDLRVARVNRVTSLQATVLLPDGYDEQPTKRWPVLFLLHGVDDDTSTWANPKYGDLLARAAGFPGIVVMPEGGRGWFTDAWVGGKRAGINWERYELDEVLPTIESRYRILPGRENHAIGGLSMGGYGAMLLAAELPSYFGTAISMSGLLDLGDPVAAITVPYFSHNSFAFEWGRFGGDYARAHDPMQLLPNLDSTRLYVATGNGIPNPAVKTTATELVLGAPTEAASYRGATAFVWAARHAGLDITFSRQAGLHAWPYWRRDLTRVLAWGPFGAAPGTGDASGTSFTYRTMAPHGNAWGLGFSFSSPPFRELTLTRTGQTLTGVGAGTITITPGAADDDASGAGTKSSCAFTATLPFRHVLPTGC